MSFERISIVISPAEKEELKRKAKILGISLSKLLILGAKILSAKDLGGAEY